MEQENLFIEDIYEALRDCVRALGGPKIVGSWFWPGKSPDKAANALNDCLNKSHNEKLDPEQVLFIIKKAKDKHCHVAIKYINNECGYADPVPLNPESEKEKLQREVIEAAKAIDRATKRLESMNDGPIFKVA